MFSKRKPAQPRGQGAAAAQQMGLYLELDPEQMVMEGNLDDPDLEAELAAITGNKAGAGGKAKPKRKSPLPMEDIAKMADECLRDIDEDEDDGNIEDDQDLLAELQEVVGVDEDDEDAAGTSSSPSPAETPESPPSQVQPTPLSCSPVKPQGAKTPSAAPAGLQHTLEERISMYQTALQNSKAAGEASKVRRYDRGLKTLQTMLTAAKKGRPVNEAEMPPPVATGAQGPDGGSAAPRRPAPPIPSPPPAPSAAPSPEEPAEEPAGQPQTAEDQAKKTALRETQKEYRMAALSAKKQGDLEQARLYLMASKTIDAAIQAVEKGEDVRLGSLPPLPGQGGSAALQRSSSGQSVPAGQPAAEAPGQSRLLKCVSDTFSSTSGLETTSQQADVASINLLGRVPPAAAFPAAPASPGNVLEALEQRRAKYAEASSQAKASGDERKARMHQRISQVTASSTLRLPPIPERHPSTQGGKGGQLPGASDAPRQESRSSLQMLPEECRVGKQRHRLHLRLRRSRLFPRGSCHQQVSLPRASSPSHGVPDGALPCLTLFLRLAAAAQLELLEGRRKQYMRAALQAKQKQDVEQAKALLRTAKSLEPLIQAVHAGTAVDTSTVSAAPPLPHSSVAKDSDEKKVEASTEKTLVLGYFRGGVGGGTCGRHTVMSPQVPSPPGDEDEDFILVHHSDVQLSDKAEQVYAQLMKILREQYEVGLRGGRLDTPRPPKSRSDSLWRLSVLLIAASLSFSQKCRTHSEQFTHLGSVAETTKFEQMAESCKKSLEVLKLAQSRGLPPPKHTFEERSFHTVRIFPELSSTDMVVIIVKGMNLPAPSGKTKLLLLTHTVWWSGAALQGDGVSFISPAFSSQASSPTTWTPTSSLTSPIPARSSLRSTEPPSSRTPTAQVRTGPPPLRCTAPNTTLSFVWLFPSLEYNQSFTLSINRSHRGFRRVVASRGLKLELLHKGGFLRSDKPIGTAVVKLDKLETQSEIREIVEVMNGRKPTGGRVEVKVRLREPLSGQDMQTSRERWLVI
ncbi:unnamed protein product, partial [Tetraodon nigroviridis]